MGMEAQFKLAAIQKYLDISLSENVFEVDVHEVVTYLSLVLERSAFLLFGHLM